jgi:serine/threonine protein kinase
MNKVVNRFLPITKSVLNGLEPEPKITDFTLLKEIGEGTFGRVLLVQHNLTQAQYAIKAIDKRNKDNIDEKDYFRREAEIMYRIYHPNIVKLYGHFEDNTYCYFIMEYMSGGNIYSLVPKYGYNKISPQLVASILKDVISAIYYLHHMNPPIIHRDIKPENILINNEMKAKLTDFGWSNYLDTFSKRTTMCGTPVYLAPELVNNTGHDHRVDIWCIGVLMFELLTGHPPWMGEDVQTLKYNISRMKINWQKHMDPDAVDLIKKILRYNPEERISLINMLIHPFFTKYYPDAVNSLIQPDGAQHRTYIISKDNPLTYEISSDYFNDSYLNNYSSSIPYIPPTNITTSFPIPTLKQPTYNSINNYENISQVPLITKIPSTTIFLTPTPNYLKSVNYSTNSLINNYNIKELIENQERIDELVRKTEIIGPKTSYPNLYSFNKYNYDYELKNRPKLYQSIYEKQTPTYLSSKNVIINDINYTQPYNNIKYSLPIKYSVQNNPVKYSKPKTIYSSMTTKRNYDMLGLDNGKRQLNSLYYKYGMYL